VPKLQDLESHRAFLGLLDALRECAERALMPENEIESEIDLVEGLRGILHLLSAGIDFYLEGDAERPEFVRIVSPTRKFLGDNPDAIYHFARIRGDRAYRVTGRKQDECYVSFTVHARAADGRLGGAAEPVLADVNDRGLALGPGGSFEIVLSRERPPDAENWIPLAESAASLITRHYYERPDSPAADPERRIPLRIEPLEPPSRRAPLSDASLPQRLRDVAEFVRGGTVGRVRPPVQPPFVSTTPNELGEPTVFRVSHSDSWGAVDIAYSMGPFRLAEGEALVMEGRFPRCAFANVVLWNKHLAAFEYRDRRVSLNRAQTRLEPDGSYRMVVAARDPGLANWLDTEGHAEGIVFWRFLLPEEKPEKPRCRVVPVAELAPR
jgi:hypothetical protein